VFNEAQKSIQGVLALDSNNQAAYENLARIYYDRGHLKDKSYLVLADLVVTQGIACSRSRRARRAPTSSTSRGSSCSRATTRSTRSRPSRRPSHRAEPRRGQPQHRLHLDPLPRLHHRREGLPDALKSAAQQKNIEVWLALGVAQRGLKKFKEAEESYNKAIKLNASDPRAFFNLGVLYQDHLRSRTAST
jgi:tetratricopeptide (TPR) repeat protein